MKPEQVRKQRNAIYGDFYPGHKNLGRVWASILSNHLGKDVPDLPAEVVCAMMVGLKLNRISMPGKSRRHHDNYVDGIVYFQLTEEATKRKK